jgi:hypothetical protein
MRSTQVIALLVQGGVVPPCPGSSANAGRVLRSAAALPDPARIVLE